MHEELTEFDDPQLKAAIVRLRGGHVARPDLVDRVRQSLDEAVEADGRPLQMPGPHSTVARRLAVAASIVLAFGLGAIAHRAWHKAVERREYLEANEGLFRGMIAVRNDQTAGRQGFGSLNDPRKLRDLVAARLEHEVPLPDLSSQGWSLERAELVSVRALPAARFLFTRGTASLTLFSLPSGAFAGAEDDTSYQTVVDGHPIAGFVRGGGVHCVVGDANTPLSDITPLTDQLRRF